MLRYPDVPIDYKYQKYYIKNDSSNRRLSHKPTTKKKLKQEMTNKIDFVTSTVFIYISPLPSFIHHSSHPCPSPHTSQCENHTQASHAFQSYRVDFQNSLGANSITRSPYRSIRERVRQSTQANNVLFYKITPHHRAL